MKIKQILSQHRRDFTAIIKCQFCNKEEKLGGGYDDRNYHDNVIPNMKCSSCSKSTISEGDAIDNTPTKYSSDTIV